MPDPDSALSVKICGLTRPEDAVAAAAAGAAYLGAVLVPSSPRAVDADSARRLGEARPGGLVLVSADAEPGGLASRARRAKAAVLQLHGEESPGDVRRLGEEGGWRIWKAVRVRSADDVKAALDRFGPVADALLLDGWHPAELGGAGASFAWEEVEEVRRSFPTSLKLVVAGGLTPENVGRAVELLRPDVVDVSSGVERRPGVKDANRVRAFVAAARGALHPT